MPIRKAQITDVQRIKQLIDDHRHETFMLPRALSELYENLRDFFVWEEEDVVHGCVGLHIMWEDLAEVKSLVVDHYGRGKGWGKALVRQCLLEAKTLKIERVFALTQSPQFFLKLGFELADKATFPQKVWAECIKCHKFPDCDETAVEIRVNALQPEQSEPMAVARLAEAAAVES